MAQLIIEIPDEFIPRIIEAYKSIMVTGDAVDLQSPTISEVAARIKKDWRSDIVRKVLASEQNNHGETFNFIDLGLS